MIIHRYWTGPPPATEPFIGNAVTKGNPAAILRDWADETLPVELTRFLAECEDRVAPDHLVRHRANIVRLWVLREFGGVWLDHDVIPLIPLEDVPPRATASHGVRCNCAMFFPIGDQCLTVALDRIRTAPPNPEGKSIEVSGELLLEDVCDRGVVRLQLPYAPDGSPIEGASRWAVHLYGTSSKAH